MNDLQENFVSSIAEFCIIKNSKQLVIPISLFRLSVCLLEEKDHLISETLEYLQNNEKVIYKYSIDGSSLKITISKDFPLLSPSETEKDVIKDKLIRRILIYKLYQIYRKEGHRFTGYPLVELQNDLEVDKKEIQRHVMYLQDEYYLEYNVADGGNCTSDITSEGIKFCEDRFSLFQELGTIRIQKTENYNKTDDSNADPRKIWVIHGRNLKARNAMFEFLRSIGLDPIEWSEAVSYTGEGTPFIGTILEKAFQTAKAAIVVLTGDDVARLKEEYLIDDDENYERNLTPQVRPNVIFEAGMAFGYMPKRTILLQLGKIRPISDISGRHILKMTNSASKRNNLVSRLRSAGCDIPDLSHKIDWLNAGDFNISVT